MMLLNDKADCCGCSLCAQSCPKGAIVMRTDAEGFAYPEINNKLCVDCGKCKAVCVFQNKPGGCDAGGHGAYAAINKNADVLMNSSSGGVFGAAAASILANGGVVAGCVFDSEFNAVHICTDNINEIQRMYGSKYVQSSLENVFENVLSILQEEREVLFTGTPCQVAAVKRYTRGIEGLYTVDLVCHGVPSGSMFRKYVAHIEHKYRGKLTGYSFRGKYAGWGKTNRAVFSSGRMYHIPAYKSYYATYYFRNLISRPSCYCCVYKCRERQGDLTICDYWGIGDKLPAAKRGSGVSGLMVNTEKGEKLLEMMRGSMELLASSYTDIAKGNGNLHTSSGEPEGRSRVMRELMENDGDACARAFLRKNRSYIFRCGAKATVSKLIPQRWKDAMHKLSGRSRS